MDIIWLVCLLITHMVAYFIGKGDGQCQAAEHDEAWEAVEKHKIDKQYEYLRWTKEREERRDA